MTLDELIQRGWSAHEAKTDEVADSLEANVGLVLDDDGAAKFMNLVNHCIGDHAGDRARARRVCEKVLLELGGELGPGGWLYLAVARHLADDAQAAGDAEQRAGADEDRSVLVRINLLTAQGYMHAGRWQACIPVYWAAIATAETLAEGHAGERAAAIVSNNIASELLEVPDRDADQTQLMERAAEAARVFWLRVGNWVNDARADYLLSLVRTNMGDPAAGRTHAERGLATIDAAAAAGERDEPVDRAFLHLARARACRDLGETDAHAAAIGQAETLAAGFEGDGLRSWFAGELDKAR
jgi:hypothetical protein